MLLLDSCLQTCMTYNIGECTVNKLLMMDRRMVLLETVYNPVWHIALLSVQWINSWWWTDDLSETCRVSWQNKFLKLVHLVGFITEKIIVEDNLIEKINKKKCAFCWYCSRMFTVSLSTIHPLTTTWFVSVLTAAVIAFSMLTGNSQMCKIPWDSLMVVVAKTSTDQISGE